VASDLAATWSQAQALAHGDRVEGGGCREAEQTRTSPAPGSAPNGLVTLGPSFANSCSLYHCFCALPRTF
jgi:hypothetical protein